MRLSELRQAPTRDFMTCVDEQRIPPLGDYLQSYVRSGSTVDPAEYRLVPLAAPSLRFVQTSSMCLTDCMLELQSKYEHFIPDGWGGRMDKGWRDLGAIGFDIREGLTLEIREINQTVCHEQWAEPRLACLDWKRLLVHAVVDFARSCQAKQVTCDAAYRDVAEQSGFEYLESSDCCVLELAG
jgi:hypothetical protein